MQGLCPISAAVAPRYAITGSRVCAPLKTDQPALLLIVTEYEVQIGWNSQITNPALPASDNIIDS